MEIKSKILQSSGKKALKTSLQCGRQMSMPPYIIFVSNGQHSKLQAQMISLPFGTCNAAFQKLDPTSFCATPREIGTTCQGDSGSGIVSDRGGNGRWEVDGVVSYGAVPPVGCLPLPGVLSGYQQVYIHRNWIRFVMGG